MPQALRNPAYHWTHLELNRPLGISDRLLGPDTAEGIWQECNAKLARAEFSARGIMRQMNVALCLHHRRSDGHAGTSSGNRCRARRSPIQVLPTFRPDRALAVESPAAWNAWVDRLAAASGIEVGDDYDRFLDALRQRHDFFHAAGCRLADHGLETFRGGRLHAGRSRRGISGVSAAASRSGRTRSSAFRSALLYELASMNCREGLGAAVPFRGAAEQQHADVRGPGAGRRLRLDRRLRGRPADGPVPRPAGPGRPADEDDPLQSQSGPQRRGGHDAGQLPGRRDAGQNADGERLVVHGSERGIERQLNSLSNQGLLSRFVGMVTDSRSFLSYPRHEYFRRILCNLLGGEMEQGLLPDDVELVGRMVGDICYRNPAGYFGFNLYGRTPPSCLTKWANRYNRSRAIELLEQEEALMFLSAVRSGCFRQAEWAPASGCRVLRLEPLETRNLLSVGGADVAFTTSDVTSAILPCRLPQALRAAILPRRKFAKRTASTTSRSTPAAVSSAATAPARRSQSLTPTTRRTS